MAQQSRFPFPTIEFIWLLVPLTVALIYSTAVDGPFLLDDNANIRFNSDLIIQDLSPAELSKAATSMARADSGLEHWLNRPISYISFALDIYVTDGDPGGRLKSTNIILHLISGGLLFWLLRLVFSQTPGTNNALLRYVPPLATAIWLSHPLMVSSVLYVVQRMTILSALFTLCGLITYVIARIRLRDSGEGLLAGVLGVTICTALACLSKENGALTPLFCGIIELWIFRGTVSKRAPRYARPMLYSALLMPLIFIIGYLIYTYANGPHEPLHYRNFTIHERWLTQFVVLGDYLRWFLLPLPENIHFLHDNLPISRSFWNPPVTGIMALLWLALAGLAAVGLATGRAIVLAVGLAWFLTGHLLESTTIPLEIIFEHRNYLPYAGLSVAFAWCLASVIQHLQRARLAAAVITVVPVVTCLGLTAERVGHWQSEEQLVKHWLQTNPTSARTWAKAGDYYLRRQNPEMTFNAMLQGSKLAPLEAGYPLGNLILGCNNPALRSENQQLQIIQKVISSLHTGPLTAYTKQQFRNLLQECIKPESIQTIVPLMTALEDFPNRWFRGRAHYILAVSKLYQGDRTAALQHLEVAQSISPDEPAVNELLGQLQNQEY